jgi:outer membrane protein assembly factor BamB
MYIFAVVPIFTSAGAALLPTILTVLASIAAIVLKPRELVGLCRRHPMAIGVWAGAIALGLVFTTWLLASGMPFRPAASSDPRTAIRCDWAKVAEGIIAQERAGKAPTSSAEDAHSDAPLVLGRDFNRCFFDGGLSPVNLKQQWSFRPEETMFISSPTVAGKRIFTAGCQSDLGGYTGLLACIDLETGKPLWQITQVGDEVLRPFFSSPALTQDGKYLVIGQGLHADQDCSLLCFDAATGRFQWAVKSSLHIESSPVIYKDMAIVGAGAIEGPDGKATGDPGYVIAVRIADGRELWRQSVNDPESSPAVDSQGTVYIGSGFNGNAIVAIRSDSDEVLRNKNLDRIVWRTPVAQPVTCAISLCDDLVIAGEGNSDVVHSNKNAKGLVVALQRDTGKIRWQRSFDDGVLGQIACRDGILICPSRTGEVTALAVNDGRVLWRAPISGNAPVLAGCAFTGRRVYAVSSDGYLAVLDAKDGKVLEKMYLNDQGKPGAGLMLSSPFVAQGRVIVGSETGGLHCLVGSGDSE